MTPPLWADHDGVRQQIRKLEIPVEVTVHVVDLPISMSSYEQLDSEGTLAWVATAEGIVDGDQVHFRMVFVPDSDGRFSVRGVEATGAERGGYLGITPT